MSSSLPEPKHLWERTVDATVRVGERALTPVERWVGRRSLVGDAAFFEPDRFDWVAPLQENWQVMRDECMALLPDRAALASFQEISRDQIELTDDDRWKTFFLFGYGFRSELGTSLCPRTTELVSAVPGMMTAMFSILSPRKNIPDHRGPYKGVLRYHLGLIVPDDAPACRIRVGDEIRHWEEGRSLVFDDTYNHEVWNDTDQTRVVLFLDVLRPLPTPEAAVNRAILKAIAWSPYIQDAKRNQNAWEARYREHMRRSADGARSQP